MATGPQQKRKELREKRMKAEASARGGDRRQNMMKVIGISVFIAVVAVVVIGFALSSGGSDDEDSSSNASGSVLDQLEGIPQNGTVLGDPKAKVTLIEFGDLQCPICKQYAQDVLPGVISGPIKSGDANFDFKQWAILGEGSILAAKAALAAARQDRYWQFLETFYANQGIENSGYVTDEFLTGIAEEAGVKDIDQWNSDREESSIEQALLDVDQLATEQGLTGTPSFVVRDAQGNLTKVEANSTDPQQNVKTITEAINKAQSQK